MLVNHELLLTVLTEDFGDGHAIFYVTSSEFQEIRVSYYLAGKDTPSYSSWIVPGTIYS